MITRIVLIIMLITASQYSVLFMVQELLHRSDKCYSQVNQMSSAFIATEKSIGQILRTK